MKRIIALILLVATLAAALTFICACKEEENPGENGEGTGQQNPGADDDSEKTGALKVPVYKDYKRGTQNFEKIKYSKPDMAGATDRVLAVFEKIEKNSASYQEQLLAIEGLEGDYIHISTMSSLTTIYNFQDLTDEYWAQESAYISENYPKYSQAIEKLFIAAAKSPHSESFAKDYFGDELFDYEDGGIYTDTLVTLMSEEARLESAYNEISTATIKISYNTLYDSYDNIIKFYRQKFGESSLEYVKAKNECDVLYKAESEKMAVELFVELLKLRRRISDELGYESYGQYAYETVYHDYSAEKMENFIDEVTKYAVPVYVTLSRYVFSQHIYNYENSDLKAPTKNEMLNTLFEVYKNTNPELFEIYSYMLQHNLYDIEVNPVRFQGAFTTYLDYYNAPFIFITPESTPLDYMTLAHEFGHFADSFVNFNATTSLDLCEVSSQALELLTLTKLKDTFDVNTYKHLEYLKLDELFSTLIFQSFYAKFEMEIYNLPENSISVENLNSIASKTAQDFGISSSFGTVGNILIPHLVLYPFYVQSYSSSAAVAAEIYCIEKRNENLGFDIYMELIDRTEENLNFEEHIKDVGLTSPFDVGSLKCLVDDIYYLIMGAHYFSDSNNNLT